MAICLLSQLYSTTIWGVIFSILLYATANLETCRPFIRVVKDDLLLTTSSCVDWNLNEELCYEGVVFLLLMLMSPICPQYPKLSFERIHSVMEVMEKDNKGKCMSGWGKFYSNCGKKYEGIVPQLESQTTQPRKTTASHPQLLDHDKLAAIDAAIKALGHKKRRTDWCSCVGTFTNPNPYLSQTSAVSKVHNTLQVDKWTSEML